MIKWIKRLLIVRRARRILAHRHRSLSAKFLTYLHSCPKYAHWSEDDFYEVASLYANMEIDRQRMKTVKAKSERLERIFVRESEEV